MKKNIEHIIKESLENHELPYNSGAWSALSAKLDSAGTPSADNGSSVDSAIKSSLENYELPYAAAAWTSLSASLDAKPNVGVDQSVKTSLENYELPYAAAAWTSLSAKLDAKNAPGSRAKWYVAAGLLITAAAVSYSIFGGSTEEKDTSSTPTEIAQTKTNKVSGTNSNETSTNGVKKNTSSNSNENGTTNGTEIINNDPTQVIGNDPVDPIIIDNGPAYVAPPITIIDPNEPTPIAEEAELAPFKMPVLNSVCQGSSIKIANENDYDMSIVYPSGSIWTGKGKSETSLKTSIVGNYIVGYMDKGVFVEEGAFEVKFVPGADFDFVDLSTIWTDGLPTTEVKATTSGDNRYEWNYGKQTASGAEAAPHFFTKGSHDITLTVTGSNGCESTVSKTVNIEDNYNLGATNAFKPTSLDIKTSTFIPQLLKERDVKFTMIIVDMNDGHVMFQTSDASQGWDGVDRTTGQMIGYHKSFVWQVTIENPQAGESPSYKGSGVAIPQ